MEGQSEGKLDQILQIHFRLKSVLLVFGEYWFVELLLLISRKCFMVFALCSNGEQTVLGL